MALVADRHRRPGAGDGVGGLASTQFFVEGTYQQADVGFGTEAFWMFVTAIVAQAFLYTWVVINTGGSILAAIVFHALTNLAGEIFNPSPSGRVVALILWALAAGVLAASWRRAAATGRSM